MPLSSGLPPTWLPLSFIILHDTVEYGTAFWPVWMRWPGRVTSQLLVHTWPSCWQGSMRSWKVLSALCKHCSVTAKTLVCYQHYSHPKPKIHYTILATRKKTISAETRTLLQSLSAVIVELFSEIQNKFFLRQFGSIDPCTFTVPFWKESIFSTNTH